MKVTVFGTGRWATFLAWYLHRGGNEVCIVGRRESRSFLELKEKRTNGLVVLDPSIKMTDDQGKGVAFAEVLVISISSQSLRALMGQLAQYNLTEKTFVLCMKGIEMSTGKRLSEIVEEYVPHSAKVAVWVGPGHVQDFVCGKHNCMVIDSGDDETKRSLIQAFSGDLIRFYYGTDLIGSEVGAAAKNVIGIAAGLLDGCGQGALKGALMARGTREVFRLIEAMGGNGISAYGLAHLGDYEATLFSPFSHNRSFGESFAKGEPFEGLAEGVSTVQALMVLKEKYHVDLPICDTVYRVVIENEPMMSALGQLFDRSLKDEF